MENNVNILFSTDLIDKLPKEYDPLCPVPIVELCRSDELKARIKKQYLEDCFKCILISKRKDIRGRLFSVKNIHNQISAISELLFSRYFAERGFVLLGQDLNTNNPDLLLSDGLGHLAYVEIISFEITYIEERQNIYNMMTRIREMGPDIEARFFFNCSFTNRINTDNLQDLILDKINKSIKNNDIIRMFHRGTSVQIKVYGNKRKCYDCSISQAWVSSEWDEKIKNSISKKVNKYKKSVINNIPFTVAIFREDIDSPSISTIRESLLGSEIVYIDPNIPAIIGEGLSKNGLLQDQSKNGPRFTNLSAIFTGVWEFWVDRYVFDVHCIENPWARMKISKNFIPG